MPKHTLSQSEFGRLYKESYASLVIVATSEVGPSAAEDVVQEAAIAASKRIKDFTPGTDFRAWLASFVRNTGRNHRRKEQRHARMRERLAHEKTKPGSPPTHPGRPATNLPGAIPRDAHDEAFDRELKDAIDALPNPMRACLLLRATLDHSYEEISSMLGIPVNTARSHVHRARARVHEAMTPFQTERAHG